MGVFETVITGAEIIHGSITATFAGIIALKFNDLLQFLTETFTLISIKELLKVAKKQNLVIHCHPFVNGSIAVLSKPDNCTVNIRVD